MADREAILKGGGIVLLSTLAVTVAFVGVLAFVTGNTPGIKSRVPFYVVAFSVAFTGLLVSLERYFDEGDQIFLIALVLSLIVGVVVSLDVEGILYASANPGQLVASQLFLYLVAAGFLCTGLVYWGVHHWREFVTG